MTSQKGKASVGRPSGLRLGVFGNEGSFSEEAGLAWARSEGLNPGMDCELLHLVDAGGLLLALAADRIDRAILPLHNTRTGVLTGMVESLAGRDFRVVGQLSRAVEQCLCLRSEAVDPIQVRAVVSHPAALAQCEEQLRQRFPEAQHVAWSDTASAARDLAVGVLPPESTAILASRSAAERFGLWIVDGNAQGARENRTSFVVLGRPE